MINILNILLENNVWMWFSLLVEKHLLLETNQNF